MAGEPGQTTVWPGSVWPGTAYPLGATYDGAGTNFSVSPRSPKGWNSA